MNEHTQGKLTTDCVEHDAPYQNIKLRIGTRNVATVWIDDAPVHDFNAEQDANARRLVACWNACDGVSTVDLEAAPGYKAAIDGFHEQRGLAVEARAQRDVLLEALRPFAEVDLRTQGVHQRFADHVLNARAAIAQGTGQKGGA